MWVCVRVRVRVRACVCVRVTYLLKFAQCDAVCGGVLRCVAVFYDRRPVH